jgi:uncharacterized protein (DUF2252 family)
MSHNIAEKIKEYNSGRIPELLKIKYKAMRDDKYRFFRAIPNILYDDIPSNSFLYNSPNVWLCGDLHLENLGSYKGDNRVTHFGINDFDECILGPLLIDVSRLMTSVYVASNSLGIKEKETHALCKAFIDCYFDKLEKGYIRVLEPETSRGVMKHFLEKVMTRKRKTFLKKRTEKKNGRAKLIIDHIHTLPASEKEKKEVEEHIFQWAKKKNTPEFYKVHDVAFRIAGTSSLGIRRYAVLVEGRGRPSGFFLLDLKETLPSCLRTHVKATQPAWKHEAERIVEVQKRVLSDPPALLASIEMGKKNFVLKELQPTADRINYALFSESTKKLKTILEDMACICAWSNLRSGGRQGSAIADELIDFAKKGEKVKQLTMEYAYSCFQTSEKYYKEYVKAYDKGFFKVVKH